MITSLRVYLVNTLTFCFSLDNDVNSSKTVVSTQFAVHLLIWASLLILSFSSFL